jgi:hypothetical protein
MTTTRERIEVMQAFVDGKEIQVRERGVDEWESVSGPSWNWYSNEYRIKPEPREIWIVETPAYPRTYTRGFKTRKEADVAMCELIARGNPATLIHYREVME